MIHLSVGGLVMRVVMPIALMVLFAAVTEAQPPLPSSPESNSIARQNVTLIPDLIAALQDPDSEVRQHTAMALAMIGHDAVKPLTEALQDPIREKRAAAAYALGYMGFEGREAMPALQKALKDEDATVRRSVAQAISRILSDELSEPSQSPRYRPRNTLPKLTVPGTQTGTVPPLDPVPGKNSHNQPPK